MSKTNLKRKSWMKKKYRTKKSLGALGQYLRLVVFRSNKHIYGQVLDVNKGITIISSSSIDNDLESVLKKNNSGKIEASKLVAKHLSDKMKKNKITAIIFDRNGYRYHGRIKAFADQLRDNGIKF